MSHEELRKSFRIFFESKNHKWVSSSSLLPDDPSVLFTTAGMQQFKPYYTGQADAVKDFGSLNVASIQKAMRTSDIDEVGDESHLTFFEMLGHFSFGDYFKKETIQWTYEFLTKELGINKDRISATVFAGDTKIPFDSESYDAWSKLIPADHIRKGPREDNVWGPNGPEGPCGAANEVYVDDIEVATLVFMEYNCDKDGGLTALPQKGVDVGWGFERIAMLVQGRSNVFKTDLLSGLIQLMPTEFNDKQKRIITDHSRAIAFLITDGVRPSNKEQGYILRRLMRRVITYFNINKADSTLMHDIFAKVIETYGRYYPELNANLIIHEFDREKEKFEKTLRQGLKEMGKMDSIDAASAFKLYESFGLPFEVIKELGGDKAKELSGDLFEEEFKKHQERSRVGAEKKFGGHGLLMDTGELKAGNEEELKKATRLHTATHLLHASLRKIFGEDVKQQGSDITPERLRFDFTFPRKLTPEEIKIVEDMVNKAIDDKLPVTKTEMFYEEAIKSGALAFFKQKYPEKVTVYTIGPVNGLMDKPIKPFSRELPNSTKSEQFFSKELCGGPHVSNTGEIGHIKITKEESVSAEVRRIRAIVE